MTKRKAKRRLKRLARKPTTAQKKMCPTWPKCRCIMRGVMGRDCHTPLGILDALLNF